MASEAVKVIVRCRPLNEREKQLGCKVVINMDSARGQCFIQNPTAEDDPPKQFTFDGWEILYHARDSGSTFPEGYHSQSL
uniref:Kinesin motor domain-containing protein n=1 Tax=Naja naja TaxID=35670 RepID=A0A8C6YHA1_NAJNA